MKTLGNKKVTSLPLTENQAFITQSFIINENPFHFEGRQLKAFQNEEFLISLEDEMLNIFRKQFETFKELLQLKKQNKEKNEPNLKDGTSSISQKKDQYNKNTDKEQNLVNRKEQQNWRRNSNANQGYQSLSFFLSKTSHEEIKCQGKPKIEMNFKKVQQKDPKQHQFDLQQKKFIRSTGFKKHLSNYNDFEKVLSSPQKLPISTCEIEDHQANHQESSLKMEKKVMIYNKLIFVREH